MVRPAALGSYGRRPRLRSAARLRGLAGEHGAGCQCPGRTAGSCFCVIAARLSWAASCGNKPPSISQPGAGLRSAISVPGILPRRQPARELTPTYQCFHPGIRAVTRRSAPAYARSCLSAGNNSGNIRLMPPGHGGEPGGTILRRLSPLWAAARFRRAIGTSPPVIVAPEGNGKTGSASHRRPAPLTVG